jgi:hypothetical protein
VIGARPDDVDKLKQITLAVRMYSDDYDGFFLVSRPATGKATGWTSEFFDFGIDPYEKSDPSSPYRWSQGRIFPPALCFPTIRTATNGSQRVSTRFVLGSTKRTDT